MSERKYRHRGYMEDSRRDDRRGRRPPEKREPRPPSDLPRPGRGMERAASEVHRCSTCGSTLQPGFVVTSDATCSACGAALHCCRNCAHFDTSARYECTQPIAAPVGSKTAANRCEFFAMRAVLDATGRRASGPAGPTDPRKAFDALFKK